MGLLGRKRSNDIGQAPTAPPRPAEMMTFVDSFGREHNVTQAEFVERILPEQLDSHWHDPDTLWMLARQSVEAGLYVEALEISERLQKIDRNPERAAATRVDILRRSGDLEAAQRTCDDFLRAHGESGLVLLQLARVYEAREQSDLATDTLWRAVQTDPNNQESLSWWASQHAKDESEEAFYTAMTDAAAIEHGWLPLLHLARRALRNNAPETDDTYKEILNRGGHDTRVLLAVIGDLGTSGRVDQIVDLVGPWYSPTRHASTVGIGILQACVDAKRVKEADVTLVKLSLSGDPYTRAEVARLALELDEVRLEILPPPTSVPHWRAQEKREPSAPPESNSSNSLRLVSETSDELKSTLEREMSNDAKPLYRDEFGWFSRLGDPYWLLPATSSTSSTEVHLTTFSNTASASDSTALRLLVSVPRLLADQLAFRTDARLHVELPRTPDNFPRLPDGELNPFLIHELASAARRSRAYVVCGTVSGNSERRQITVGIYDGEAGTKQWSSTAVAADNSIGRAIEEVAYTVEEWLSEHRLAHALSSPIWFTPVPAYLASRYLDAETDALELSLAAHRVLPHDAISAPPQSLDRLASLCRDHASSILPKLLYLSGLHSVKSIDANLLTNHESVVHGFLRAEPSPRSAIRLLTPWINKLFPGTNDEFATAAAVANQPTDDPRFVDWLARLDT